MCYHELPDGRIGKIRRKLKNIVGQDGILKTLLVVQLPNGEMVIDLV